MPRHARLVMTLAAPACAAALSLLGGSVAVPVSTGPAAGPASVQVLAPTLPVAVARVSAPTRSATIDVTSRGAVDAAYQKQWRPTQSVATGWTGSDAGCHAGTISSASRTATRSALNFARALNKLGPVTFTSALDSGAQKAALIMSANGSLSHDPPRSWACWSSAGAAAAGRSNLALSSPRITSGGAISLYLSDPGSGNTAVGHRRWLLNPFATRMGDGSTATTNAITVIGPTSSSRPNPAWTAWPSTGYFPNTLAPGRWSLSSGDSRTSFARATVRVSHGTTAVPVKKLPVVTGYAMPTLAWQMPASYGKRVTYKVVVRGIHRSGTSKVWTRTYDVRLFTPAR